MYRKKLFILFLVSILAFLLIGCQNADANKPDTTDEAPSIRTEGPIEVYPEPSTEYKTSSTRIEEEEETSMSPRESFLLEKAERAVKVKKEAGGTITVNGVTVATSGKKTEEPSSTEEETTAPESTEAPTEETIPEVIEMAPETVSETTAPAPVPTPPYLIKVNRTNNFVAVYSKDDNGEYTVPVQVFECSTGRPDSPTPAGEFSIYEKCGQWHALFGNVFGQWCVRFNGHILFHSVPYYGTDPGTVETEEYDKLGTSASAGCVRMKVSDVKWIYDNCDYGTKVIVYDGADTAPMTPSGHINISQYDAPYRNWDPSDTALGNPWAQGAPEKAVE